MDLQKSLYRRNSVVLFPFLFLQFLVFFFEISHHFIASNKFLLLRNTVSIISDGQHELRRPKVRIPGHRGHGTWGSKSDGTDVDRRDVNPDPSASNARGNPLRKRWLQDVEEQGRTKTGKSLAPTENDIPRIGNRRSGDLGDRLHLADSVSDFINRLSEFIFVRQFHREIMMIVMSDINVFKSPLQVLIIKANLRLN